MLYYLTSNKFKFREAKNYLLERGIEIESRTLEIPEIQAEESSKISKYSAEYAQGYIKEPFFVMDRSLHIEAFKGFPGPYVKYVNKWLNEKVISKLLKGEPNRKAYWQTSIAYCDSNDISIFEGKLEGILNSEPRGTNGWLFDKFFVPRDEKQTLAELPTEQRDAFWTSCLSWNKFADQLQNSQRPSR